MKKVSQAVEIIDKRDSSPLKDIEYRHPSYGLLQISRISSNQNQSLFGSSINHQHTIMIRINKAAKHRSHNSDWFMDYDMPYVEVEMSAAQFAEAITSLNIGSGVPCTVRYANGDRIEFAPEKTKTEEHTEEYEHALNKAAENLKKAQGEIHSILDKKSINKGDRNIIRGALSRFVSFATGNSKFYKKQFDEQMEKTVVEAKSEIEAFATHEVYKAGLQSVKDNFKLNE